jgi:hypothetical protein
MGLKYPDIIKSKQYRAVVLHNTVNVSTKLFELA